MYAPMLHFTLKECKMSENILLYGVTLNSIQTMQSQAQNRLNPHNHYLSNEAQKRLVWMYILYYECNNNVTQAANKIGLSREWLSKIKTTFERSGKNPKSLEPESRAPRNTSNRERIPKDTEEKILEVRDEYGWGEKKIVKVLGRDYQIKTSKNTVNRYLHKHHKIDPKLSRRSEKAWQEKKEREKQKEVSLKAKYRPPTKIKDYLPGALVEKDMKLVPRIDKPACFNGKYHLKENFYYQHTFIDSFTRIRAMELSIEPNSLEATQSYSLINKRIPFKVATMNTDNGSENEKNFSKRLQQDEIFHFYSRSGTPTDNPRVERSHLTDEKEFYGRGNIYKTFEEQKEALKKWEYIYNYVRPHQALGQLTPMEFYRLWKVNPTKAYRITEKYQAYLRRQRIRLSNSRKIKRREQIEKLMQFIDAKLEQKVELKPYKLELIKCELCSWG